MKLWKKKDFWPNRFIRGPHAQTIIAAYCSQKCDYQATRDFVPLNDGDQIAIHDDCPADWKPGDPVVLMLHGLTGCHLSSYMVRIAYKLKRHGVRTFRMDMRSCGDSTSKHLYHAARLTDISQVVQRIQQRCDTATVSIASFSLGAAMALRLAGELGTTRMGIDRIVAVAPPIDLHLCCSNLRKRPNHHYDRYFMKKLVQIATSPDNQISKHHQLDIDPLPKSVLEFDTRVTAPVSGFRDVDDYYTQASAKSVLAKISVPTLIITSQDDPIIPIQQFDDVRMPSNIELWTTRFGGHLGFLSSRRRNDPDRHWMDWRVVENLIEAKVV